MANIDTYLESILNDAYGEDVRGSIQLALSAITDEAMLYGLSFKEALTALLPAIGEHLDRFVVPNGTLDITQPGTYDVTNYDKARINIQDNKLAYSIIQRNVNGAVFSETLTDVKNNMFRACTGLTRIELPNCTNIADTAFYGCTNLSDVYLPGNVVPTLGNYQTVFSGTKISYSYRSSGKIHVNPDLLSQYRAAENWLRFYTPGNIVPIEV